MIEDFIDSLRNFSRNKTRTVLSLLGVIIGVASVIVITSMGASTTRQIQNMFSSSGLDMVSVRAGGFMRRSRDAIPLKFNEAFRAELFDNIRNIRKVWYKNSANCSATFGDTTVSCEASAVETGYLEAYRLALDSGDYFSITDSVYGAQKMILGSEVASSLFPDGNAVGKNVLAVFSGVSFSFTVIGVLKEQLSGLESSTSVIFIPRGFYDKKMKPNPDADEIMVQTSGPNFCAQMTADLTNFINEKAGVEGAAWVYSMQTMVDEMDEMTKMLSMMLSGVAAISLLVGGIGIMNIMIVTVTERRQEIGIRKALGARPAVICRQFLVESASITLFGGTLGIIFGIGISLAIEFVKSNPYSIQISACVVSFFFSVFVGVFFGLSPAIRASRLDPVEALAG